MLAHTDFDLRCRIQPHVALVCRLNGLHLSNPCKYMDYYSFTDPGGLEGWVGWVGWPIADSLYTKPKTDVKTTELRRLVGVAQWFWWRTFAFPLLSLEIPPLGFPSLLSVGNVCAGDVFTRRFSSTVPSTLNFSNNYELFRSFVYKHCTAVTHEVPRRPPNWRRRHVGERR